MEKLCCERFDSFQFAILFFRSVLVEKKGFLGKMGKNHEILDLKVYVMFAVKEFYAPQPFVCLSIVVAREQC